MLAGRISPVPLIVLVLAVAVSVALSDTSVNRIGERNALAEEESGPSFTIYAHRLGLVGGQTANGHIIEENDRFVTLPCYCALSSLGGYEFQVRVTYEDKSVVLPVWDVGPWNVNDNFWDPPEAREWPDLPQGLPQAQAAFEDDYNDGLDGWGREVSTPAGMDIADGAFWDDLGMTDSDWVEVEFLWLDAASVRTQSDDGEIVPPEPIQIDPPDWVPEVVPIVYPGQRPPLAPVEPLDDVLCRVRFGFQARRPAGGEGVKHVCTTFACLG
jgi:hypothetical protein